MCYTNRTYCPSLNLALPRKFSSSFVWKCHSGARGPMAHEVGSGATGPMPPVTRQWQHEHMNCVSTVSAASGRYQLRSTGSAAYVLPRTWTKFAEHGFFYSGPAAFNNLPSDLHDITDTSTFRKRLKNVLLIVLTTDYCWRCWTSRIAASYKSRVDWLIDWFWAGRYFCYDRSF